ncbi:MAG: hypothetical protein AAFN41_05560 [Planctomycetota bacterium]
MEQFAAGAEGRDASAGFESSVEYEPASAVKGRVPTEPQTGDSVTRIPSMKREEVSNSVPDEKQPRTREQRLQKALGAIMPEAPELDPAAKPTFALNVRLNAYELGLLRLLAKKQDRSQHWVLKKNLIPILEKLAKEAL